MTLQEQQQPLPTIPTPPPLLLIGRYAKGFKYCKSCSKWFKPKNVVYDEKKCSHCPDCN